jgi:hypothetical protein
VRSDQAGTRDNAQSSELRDRHSLDPAADFLHLFTKCLLERPERCRLSFDDETCRRDFNRNAGRALCGFAEEANQRFIVEADDRLTTIEM